MQELAVKRDRRGLLIGAAMFASAYIGLRWWNSRPEPAVFELFDGLPGFRQVAGGKVSTGAFNPLVGLEASDDPVPPIALKNLCGALFSEGTGPGVPVAFFTDYFCPYCRVMSKFLADSNARGDIVLTVHEMPVLNDDSEVAARAALAAAGQGAYEALNRRLMRSRFVPDTSYLIKMAESAGLDAPRLLREMNSEEVSDQLRLSKSVAARFGFFATPSLVIGRTVVVGSLSEERLALLVEQEVADPGDVC